MSDGHEDMMTLYYLPDLGVTGHDRGGPYIDLYAGDPGDVAAAVERYRNGGAPAPELAPFDVVNTRGWRQYPIRPDVRADGVGESEPDDGAGSWQWDLEPGPRGLPGEYR